MNLSKKNKIKLITKISFVNPASVSCKRLSEQTMSVRHKRNALQPLDGRVKKIIEGFKGKRRSYLRVS